MENKKTSKIILGCMRISGMSVEALEALIEKSLKLGINTFDHADIYGGGKSEELFGEVLLRRPELREKMFIQSKCGICKGFYDSSYEHIIASVEGSLNRLKTNYLDSLLIHRPDVLMDPYEVANAFNELYERGLVKQFGVSNMTPLQIELIQSKLDFKLFANQIQFSIVHSNMIDNDVSFNMKHPQAMDSTYGIGQYCQLKNIEIQTWSSLMDSWEDGCFIDNPKYSKLNEVLESLAIKYHVTKSAIALSFNLSLPQIVKVIVGTTSIKHLEELNESLSVKLSKKEWYSLYTAGGKILP